MFSTATPATGSLSSTKPIECPNPDCPGSRVTTTVLRVAASPGDGPFARVLSQLPVSANGLSLPLLFVLIVASVIGFPVAWQAFGWVAILLYVLLGIWILLRLLATYAIRNGSLTLRQHVCMRCRYGWNDSLSERNLEIERFRWEANAARKRGDAKTLAASLSSLGGLGAMYAEDLHDARANLEESLRMRRGTGTMEEGYTLNNLAFTLHYLGQSEAALRPAEEAAHLLREIREWNGLASALNTLGLVRAELGDGDGAQAAFGEAAVLKLRMCDWESVAWNLEGLAPLAADRGESERAVRLFSAAACIRDEGRYYLLSQARTKLDETLARLREELGEAAYADAWGIGRSLTPQGAVAYALNDARLAEPVAVPRTKTFQPTIFILLAGLAVGIVLGQSYVSAALEQSRRSAPPDLQRVEPTGRSGGAAFYNFEVFADEFQFYLEDANPQGSSASPLFWSDAALDQRLAVLGDIMAVGTVRSVDVPVEVWLYKTAPDTPFDSWDHVVEGSLRLKSGKLVVRGTTEVPTTYLEVEPGTYRVRALMARLESGDGSGVRGEDYYRIEVWPAPYSQARVLKMWVER